MCLIVMVGEKEEDELDTSEKLLNFTGEILPAYGYTQIILEYCLCQVDVRKTLDKCGYKYVEDYFGYFWLTDYVDHNQIPEKDFTF
jgi:hypothetical protein